MLTNYEQKLKEIKSLIEDLGQNVLTAHKTALSAFKNRELEKFDEVFPIIKNIHSEANNIDNLIVKTLALYGPEATELRELISFLKITNELVRVGDYAKTYAKSMRAHIQSEVDFATLDNFIIQLHQSAIKALSNSLKSINAKEVDEFEECYRITMVEESKTDDIFKLLEKEVLANLCDDPDKMLDYLNIISTARKIERAADRAVDIAKLLLFAKKGGELESF
ncbi:phosphate signaling complex PhoU family protein [Nitrosophilus alvini]|uniref:phosphate signaling complex PhoU family protein n=1 Tax=Nitrosophilus alvini TaxID=2714855 RepID=UPI00190CB6B2|nr:PhoU domain-containing protein [Nitrosophilus alvini]